MLKLLLISPLFILSAIALTAKEKKAEATDITVDGMPFIIDTDVPLEQTGGQKVRLLHVAVLSNVEGNNEFKRNVGIMQRHQENIQALQRTIQTVEDEELKSKLNEELQKAVDRLNSDNKKMLEAYGFSLTRRYEQVVEKSHIYMYVTEDEAEEFLKNYKKSEADSAE